MLNILLYIQSKLYPDIEEAEVLVLFGDKLVKYEMFEVAQELLDDKEVFHTLNMYPEEYAEGSDQECLREDLQESGYWYL